MHADSLGVAPGQKSGAGGSADRGGDHEVGELAPFFGEAINVGRFDLGRAKAAKVAVTLVIGEDDDEVGFVGGLKERRDHTENEDEAFDHDGEWCRTLRVGGRSKFEGVFHLIVVFVFLLSEIFAEVTKDLRWKRCFKTAAEIIDEGPCTKNLIQVSVAAHKT